MAIPEICNAEKMIGSELLYLDAVGFQEKKRPLLKVDTLEELKPKKGSSFKQIVVALAANVGTMNTGLVFGYSAVSLPQLQAKGSRLLINRHQASWIASVSTIGTPCGCILSGYLTDLVGRKKTLLFTQLPAIIGWIMIGSATSVEWIYVGRFLAGLSSGMIGAPSRVYTCEVSQPHLRGVLSGFASVGTSLGVMLEYLAGSILDWYTLAYFNALLSTTALCAAFFIPESPSWLISSQKDEKRCKASLKRVRDSTCDVDVEVNNLVTFSENNTKLSAKKKLKMICQASTVKPFLILTTYFILSQYSGLNVVTFYAVDIIKDSGSTLDKYVATILLGVIRLLFTVIGCMLMWRFGRKTLSYVSSIGCGLSMVCFGGYMVQHDIWKSQGITPRATWVPVMNLSTFYAASTIGYLIVPWVMIGEVYPNQVRGVVGGLTTCVGHFSLFVVLQTYPIFQEHFTKPGTFFIYGVVALSSTLFIYLYLPETKGKSLQEIEESFVKKKKPDIGNKVVVPDIVNNLPKAAPNVVV
ncbi:facilitated trehalose transporter Tret1-like [Adelges cooleyi]|uniref:facilitated trehalose transporter Tret1-like n=1 Tax=Adelges cooleyi TaxID=133065 RepID=UPI00217F8DDB|nr:facilitated trehalose transporter Tret1-like [Adelges cooleyi]